MFALGEKWDARICLTIVFFGAKDLPSGSGDVDLLGVRYSTGLRSGHDRLHYNR